MFAKIVAKIAEIKANIKVKFVQKKVKDIFYKSS